MGSVWIAGSYQSDFARNYAREGLEISDMVAEALQGTLRSAGLEPEDVESIHVGNAFGQLFTGQGQLGAMPATVEPRLWGKPAARHEAACASGSVAVLAATAEIEAGRYDCVLVLAVEQERNVPGADAPKHLGAAAWIGHEGRMLHDAARQVTGQAGDCQVDGARTFATLNIGGSLTTTVSFVVTAEK
jgi:acetyl-CoA C-acetyltransferase